MSLQVRVALESFGCLLVCALDVSILSAGRLETSGCIGLIRRLMGLWLGSGCLSQLHSGFVDATKFIEFKNVYTSRYQKLKNAPNRLR